MTQIFKIKFLPKSEMFAGIASDPNPTEPLPIISVISIVEVGFVLLAALAKGSEKRFNLLTPQNTVNVVYGCTFKPFKTMTSQNTICVDSSQSKLI